ncbi:pCQ3_59 [Janibacter hoylei PVAS-1]|uniref:PCQ3_59 n=1 Tax=Janibacter hoylei PVAS-1 TaxID=1210046 RepID=K1E0C7_9MICO|nr:hypothetical protein [Janibacter hoylei]EKA62265.1 pCQ3_59 [Janibacter hoylei PVAS-1]RWU85748.1 hypothetical protein CWN80_01945 [Janibacter hoylei PVAS-1]
MAKHATPRALTILGREPAAWVGLVEALLALLVVFTLGVSAESAVLIMAVVSALAGVYTAWTTRDTALGAIVGLAKASISLAAYYGLDLSVGQQGALMALVPVLLGFWQRTQTAPVSDPVDPSPAQVVPVTDDTA